MYQPRLVEKSNENWAQEKHVEKGVDEKGQTMRRQQGEEETAKTRLLSTKNNEKTSRKMGFLAYGKRPRKTETDQLTPSFSQQNI